MPRLTVERELETGELVAIPVDEIEFRRVLRLVHRRNAKLSYAATAFLQVVRAVAVEKGAPFLYQVERGNQELIGRAIERGDGGVGAVQL